MNVKVEEQKNSKMISMLTGRCPSCHSHKIFKYPLLAFKQPSKMYESCPKCGEDFKREPGFYFGAAYVSYAITVALWVAVFVALYSFDMWGLIEFTFTEDPGFFFGTGVVVLFILLLPIYRLSRSMWLGMFVKKKE